jgi:FkbM family methyltransferase
LAKWLSKLALLLAAPEWLRLRRHGVSQEFYLHMKAAWWKAFGFDTIVDVGANTGQFVHLAKALFPAAQVFAFEPQADVYRVLERGVGTLGRVHCFNAACGAREGSDVFFRNAFSPASSLLPLAATHRAAFPYATAVHEERVHVTRLDDALAPYGPLGCTLIKLDVQGSEDQVIEGGRNTLRAASVVIAEVSFVSLFEGQPLFEEILASLAESGFRCAGYLDQLVHPQTGQPLQADAIFVRRPA